MYPLRAGRAARVKIVAFTGLISDVHFNNSAEEWLCAFTKVAFFLREGRIR